MKLRGRIFFFSKEYFEGEHLQEMIRISKLNVFNKKKILIAYYFYPYKSNVYYYQKWERGEGEEIIDLLGFNLNHSYFEVNKHLLYD